MPFDLLKQALFMYQDPSKIPAFLQDAQKKVAAADGFIFVSAEYYNSIPPALSSMVDHFAPWDYLFKPSAIITYSSGKSETIMLFLGRYTPKVGVVLSFFLTRRLGPSIYCLPLKNIRNIKKHLQKEFEIFINLTKYPNSLPCPLKKTLKCIEMTPKTRPIL